jgi:hypothetical protein
VICSKCNDLHTGKGLGLRDGGVSFGLGDCRGGGGPHAWTAARMLGPAPLVISYGRYDFRKVSSESAQEWLRLGPVICLLPTPEIAFFMELVLRIPACYDRDARFIMDAGDEALVPLMDKRPTLERLRTRGLEGIEWSLGLLRRID